MKVSIDSISENPFNLGLKLCEDDLTNEENQRALNRDNRPTTRIMYMPNSRGLKEFIRSWSRPNLEVYHAISIL